MFFRWLLLRWLLLTFSLGKSPLRETGCLSNFFGYSNVTGTPTWLLRLVKVSTSSELYPNTSVAYFFLIAQASSFLIHPSFPIQSFRPPVVTCSSLCSTSVTCRTPCLIGHQALPTQPLPRKAENFPRGERHFKYVPPFTYLI